MRMRSAFSTAAAALLLLALAACDALQDSGPPVHPNVIIIREFAFSPGVVTLDPSFGFSLYRGAPGVPPRQRAASVGRAVAFSVADAMAQQLGQSGYDVICSDTAMPEPGARALIVSGTFRHIDEGRRRRVGAENPSVAVDAEIQYHAGRAAPQRLAAFQIDSRQASGEVIAVSARQGADVKAASARLGGAIARYVADAARLNKWPGAAR